MKENQVQAAKYESKYTFKEVDKHSFNDHILFSKKNYKLTNSNEVVYYTSVTGGRVIAKVDLLNRRFYLAKKNNLSIDSVNNKL